MIRHSRSRAHIRIISTGECMIVVMVAIVRSGTSGIIHSIVVVGVIVVVVGGGVRRKMAVGRTFQCCGGVGI